MRHCLMFTLAALASVPTLARAQTAPPPPVGEPLPLQAFVDFGVRGTSTNGDAARYQRYRDLGDGGFIETFSIGGEKGRWFYDAGGEHVGRKDQRFTGSFVLPGKFKGWARWDQIPMLMSVTTSTIMNEPSPGVFDIPTATQALLQATPSATQPAAFSQIFGATAQTFELSSRRHIGAGQVEYLATPELTLKLNLRQINRDGTIPYGGSFGHSQLVEIAAPVKHSTTDFETGAEFSRDRLLVRGSVTGSWFHNDLNSLTFDNPFRADDAVSAMSRGRMSVPQSNSFVGVHGLASVKMPARSRATAYVSFGSLKDAGDALMPHTINSALPAVPLPRSTVEGSAKTSAVNLTFTSQPKSKIDFNVRYRMYDYDNRTPLFEIRQRVAYDNTVSNLTTPLDTEPFGLVRHTFDADVRLQTPLSGTAAGAGYSRYSEERTHRIFESTSDDIFRLTFDSLGYDRFAVRTKYEHGRRRGHGDEAEIAAELLAIGEQPGMRHYDIASRNRNRLTVVGTMTASSSVALNASAAVGKDDYIESEFGVRDNTHRVYSAGFDAVPTEQVSYGASYSYERYNALSRSRQATSAQFNDPSRNWATDATDRAHSLLASAEIAQIKERVTLRFVYDLSHTRGTYNYITGSVPDRTLPEEVEVPTTLPPPTQLDPVTSELQRGTADLIYAVNSRLSIGLSYWHERYRVTDFTLDADANPSQARGRVMLIGYLYRPYTANTVWGRLIYRW
jgi:MtrB/PioB family decaheme-associated outer membrane protein